MQESFTDWWLRVISVSGGCFVRLTLMLFTFILGLRPSVTEAFEVESELNQACGRQSEESIIKGQGVRPGDLV